MQPTGTECARCERRRLRRRVETLQEQLMSRDRRIADLDESLAHAAWDQLARAKLEARVAELEAECERMHAKDHERLDRIEKLELENAAVHRECSRLEEFEPRPGRRLIYRKPNEVRVRFPDSPYKASFGYLPEEVEIHF